MQQEGEVYEVTHLMHIRLHDIRNHGVIHHNPESRGVIGNTSRRQEEDQKHRFQNAGKRKCLQNQKEGRDEHKPDRCKKGGVGSGSARPPAGYG